MKSRGGAGRDHPAQIVALFRELTACHGLTLIFIAHDLAIVRNPCERVVVGVTRCSEIAEDGPRPVSSPGPNAPIPPP